VLTFVKELKGNIRVYCRIRPLLGGEVSEFGEAPAMFIYPPHNDRAVEISTSCVRSYQFIIAQTC
jgi:hypothetical protein